MLAGGILRETRSDASQGRSDLGHHRRHARRRGGARRHALLPRAERNEQVRDLEREVSAADEVGKARGWRRIEAEHAEDFEALKAPKRYRSTAERMTTLDLAMLDLTDEALEARRVGDRELFEAKLAAAELLDARYDEAASALGVPVCAAA